MNTERSDTGSASGGSSLLVIFAVLCLVTFAVLGLVTVGADQRLVSDMTAAVGYYYDADFQAQEILARLRAGEVPDGVTADGQDEYAWTVALPNGLVLDCRVRIGRDGEYGILRWATVRGTEWKGDFSLPVWDGD